MKLRPLIAGVGVKFQEERIQSEQCRHQHDTAVTILDIGRVARCLHQQALRIDEDMPLLALDPLARVKTGRIDAPPPFLALLTLWLSMIVAVGLASRSAAPDTGRRHELAIDMALAYVKRHASVVVG